jgi:hypothetical protein
VRHGLAEADFASVIGVLRDDADDLNTPFETTEEP